MAITYNPRIVTDGLVLCLDAGNTKSFNAGISTTAWNDLSGRGNNTTLTNGPTFDSANGGSIVFDGVNDYAEISQPAITFSPNQFTVCVWMKPNNQSSRFITPQSAGIDHWLGYDALNQQVYVQITELADTNNRYRAGTSNTIPVGQWSYSCVSINNLNIKIYANSVFTNEYNETISIANWENNWVLGQRGNSTNWYSGSFSSLKVYNRELTAAEIQQNFNATRGRYGI